MVVGYLIKSGKIADLRKLNGPLRFYRERAESAGVKLNHFGNGFSVVMRMSISVFKEVSRPEFNELTETFRSGKPL